ncbi:restriction endonuclease subunit M [Actinospica robiniae]|uniref:restriction endonuclease subunit M n=1 Tax=Actinospica robiniae TaxID=304901 RepID=UPI000556A6EB
MPAANRVYAESSASLMTAELGVFNQAVLGGSIEEVAVETIGGVPYLTFNAAELSEQAVRYLSNLSSIFALFRLAEDGGLYPVPLTKLDRLDDDLLTIQKYAGKTNEHFTKMLLNATIMSTASPEAMIERTLRVFDPMCGRGTTLNQALMYGYDAFGVDIDHKDFEAYSGFLRTWLQRKRVKHTIDAGPVRRDRKLLGHRFEATLGLSREEYKAGEKRQITLVNADTLASEDFFPAARFDVVVTDAPYGVQHGSRNAGGLSRSPLSLLEDAVPVWARLLRPGGAIGISWNTFVADREKAVEVLAGHGLEVFDDGPYRGFRHRVDQSIMRDIIIARKPL